VEGLPSVLRPESANEVVERLRAARAGTPFVLFRDGDRDQRIVELAPETPVMHIGRGPACEIALTWDGEVSRVHALLERAGGHWTLVDDGLSRNGSYVNGQRLHGRRRLAEGDAITIGHTLLIFRAGAPAEGRTTAVTKDGEPPRLSDAQLRVLTALCGAGDAGGLPVVRANQEIADMLFLSVETVKSHLRAMFGQFGVADLPQNRKRGELARRAIAMGVVRVASADSVPRHAESSL
jgi:pSer/pThr/pTyr-binding forkhead associated (FHA) protein